MARPNRIYFGADNPNFRPAFDRFVERCRFDATTGCVLWTGGTTAGKGNTVRYGSFWDGKRWSAHRWAGIHIHGLDFGDGQAAHVCPHGANSLCVQHIAAQSQIENLKELNDRLKARALQSSEVKQHWLFVAIGIREPEPEIVVEPDLPPFYEPPEWLRPYLKKENSDDCPF